MGRALGTSELTALILHMALSITGVIRLTKLTDLFSFKSAATTINLYRISSVMRTRLATILPLLKKVSLGNL